MGVPSGIVVPFDAFFLDLFSFRSTGNCLALSSTDPMSAPFDESAFVQACRFNPMLKVRHIIGDCQKDILFIKKS